jgi:hypothetical protein
MRDDSAVDVDRKLRDVFRPDATAVDRVAEAALAASFSRRRGLLAGFVVGVVAVVTALGLVTWLSRPPAVAPTGTAAQKGSAELSGFFADGVLVVPVPDAGVVIVGLGERDPRPPDGYGIVLVEGEAR